MVEASLAVQAEGSAPPSLGKLTDYFVPQGLVPDDYVKPAQVYTDVGLMWPARAPSAVHQNEDSVQAPQTPPDASRHHVGGSRGVATSVESAHENDEREYSDGPSLQSDDESDESDESAAYMDSNMFLDVWQVCSYMNPAEMEALSAVSFYLTGSPQR